MEAIADHDWYSFRGMIRPGGSIGKVEERRAGDQMVIEYSQHFRQVML